MRRVESIARPTAPASARSAHGPAAPRGGALATWVLAFAGGAGCGPPGSALPVAPPSAGAPGSPAEPAPAPPPHFATRRERAAAGRPEHLAALDFDGDGCADLALLARTAREGFFYRGSPAGLAAEPERFEAGDYALRPAVVDGASFGGTGPALAVASRGKRAVRVISFARPEASGAGSAAPARALATFELGPSVPRALAAGRLDGARAPQALAVAADGELWILAAGTEPRRFELPRGRARCALALAPERESAAGAVLLGFQDSSALELRELGRADALARRALPGIPRDLCAEDFDGDGDLDLAVAAGQDSVLVLGLARAGGVRAALEDAAPLALAAPRVPLRLVWDGAAEPARLFALSFDSLAWRAFARAANSKLPAFELAEQGYAGQSPMDLALADFDGDGRGDLAFANLDAHSLGFLAGGEGGFDAPLELDTGGSPQFVAAGDLDGDGHPELAVSSASEGALWVHALARSGEPERPALRFELGASPRPACIADLDGDGRSDLACAFNAEQGRAVVLFGGATLGELGRERAELAHGQRVADLECADLDGDGRLELILADPDAGRLARFGVAAGTRELALQGELACATSPRALARIDWDGDGPSELAVALGGSSGRRGVAIVGERAGQLAELAYLECDTRGAAFAAARDVAAADFDGDGRDDVALFARADDRAPAGELSIWLSGAGGVALAARVPTGANVQRIAAGDVDGDGRADVLCAAQDAHIVHAWLARAAPQGAAGLALEPQAELGAGRGPLDVALCDLDGDGRLDVAVANGFSGTLSVIRNLAP